MKDNVETEGYLGVKEERLSIEVTTQCNSACLHCFARDGFSKLSSMPVNLAKKIIAEGYNAGYRHLHITGGEPLLWDGLFEVLNYVVDLGYETVFLNTNGTLITEGVSGLLSAYGDLSISVSLEGSEALHNRLRGEGSYRRAVRGIKKALDDGIQPIIFTTVCKALIPDLPHFVNDLYERFPGIKYLTLIALISGSENIFNLSEEFLDPDDFLQMVRTVFLLNLYGLKTNVLNDPLVNVVSKLLGMPWMPKSHALPDRPKPKRL